MIIAARHIVIERSSRFFMRGFPSMIHHSLQNAIRRLPKSGEPLNNAQEPPLVDTPILFKYPFPNSPAAACKAAVAPQLCSAMPWDIFQKIAQGAQGAQRLPHCCP